MPRVVGCDPGTSRLDLLLLVDGRVVGSAGFEPDADPAGVESTLRAWGPIDLVAAPSGYGLPLTRGEALDEAGLDLMSLIRPEERGRPAGVGGFRKWVRATRAAGWPCVFLPGGVHLPSIPAHRKANAIDLGTADKVAVAALALHLHRLATGEPFGRSTFALVEVGSAFTAVLVVEGGAIVDASAGTRGPIGVRSAGALDGEAAYRLGPLAKSDLFRGGLDDLGGLGPAAFAESLVKHVAGLRAVTPFDRIYLSGARRELAAGLLDRFGAVAPLPSLPGAACKHAAQGAALIADGLAGGVHADLVESLRLREAGGTALDHLRLRPPGAG